MDAIAEVKKCIEYCKKYKMEKSRKLCIVYCGSYRPKQFYNPSGHFPSSY